MRCLNPGASCFQATLCKKTRIVLNPIPAAQPSSRSMVVGSNVAACHISNWLIAVLGKKLAPVIHLLSAYQAAAFSWDQIVALEGAAAAILVLCFLEGWAWMLFVTTHKRRNNTRWQFLMLNGLN